MQREWLVAYFENSPAIRLIRADLAPFILEFLCREFKSGGAVSRSASELLASLGAYQEQLHETQADILTNSPEHYLASWTSGETRWMRRFLESGHSEAMFELSSHSEDVIKFLENIRNRDTSFIGTESRLKRIMDALHDLALGASDDPELRLKHLTEQRDLIEAEILRIQTEGIVPTYHPTAIRERFADTLADLVQLLGDFRSVEEAFKEITRSVQRMQLRADQTRGQILGNALDAEDGLKGQDQGVSFNEFAKLILSPKKQEQLDQTIARLQEIDLLAQNTEGMQRIRDMIPSLTAEARKVLRTYQRLSKTLRRLLDHDSRTERQHLANVLAEIRTLAANFADDEEKQGEIQMTVELDPEIALPMERPFWTPEAIFADVHLQPHEVDLQQRLAAFEDLAAYRSLNWSALRRRIRDALGDRQYSTLADILSGSSLTVEISSHVDAIEVLGMVQIAHEDGHPVDAHITDWVQVRHGEANAARVVWFEIPRVTFSREVATLDT